MARRFAEGTAVPIEAYQPRYLAVQHDYKARIIEGQYGGVYRYAQREPEARFEGWSTARYDPPLSPSMTTTHTLTACPIHGPFGQLVVYLPSDWPDEVRELWFHANAPRVLRIAPALRDPHQVTP
jgi:hypothetical protein